MKVLVIQCMWFLLMLQSVCVRNSSAFMYVYMWKRKVLRLWVCLGQKNALDILVASSREVVLSLLLSPPEGKTLRMDQVLHNNLIDKPPKHVTQCFC